MATVLMYTARLDCDVKLPNVTFFYGGGKDTTANILVGTWI